MRLSRCRVSRHPRASGLGDWSSGLWRDPPPCRAPFRTIPTHAEFCSEPKATGARLLHPPPSPSAEPCRAPAICRLSKREICRFGPCRRPFLKHRLSFYRLLPPFTVGSKALGKNRQSVSLRSCLHRDKVSTSEVSIPLHVHVKSAMRDHRRGGIKGIWYKFLYLN